MPKTINFNKVSVEKMGGTVIAFSSEAGTSLLLLLRQPQIKHLNTLVSESDDINCSQDKYPLQNCYLMESLAIHIYCANSTQKYREGGKTRVFLF